MREGRGEEEISTLQEDSCAEKNELLFNGVSIRVNNVQIFHIQMYKEKKGKKEGREE